MPESDDSDDAEYYISSFSGGGSCVGVARLPGGEYAVRNSHDHAARVVFTREEWVAFVRGVKNDEFDF